MRLISALFSSDYKLCHEFETPVTDTRRAELSTAMFALISHVCSAGSQGLRNGDHHVLFVEKRVVWKI